MIIFRILYFLECTLFVVPLIPLFWTPGDVCPGFQSQGGSSSLHASSSACNGFLKVTSGATSANLLVASMAAELFSIHILASLKNNHAFCEWRQRNELKYFKDD